MTLKELISRITPIDDAAVRAAWSRWDSIAKPLRSLGLLEETIVAIAGMTGNARVDLSKRGVVVLCADNGVVAEGVTQCGSDVTAVVTENLTHGTTSVCQMARVAHADVLPVDIGVARNVDGPGLLHHKIAYGTKNIAVGPAMSRGQALDAILYGAELVQLFKSQGYRILATGEMGIGNTTTSSAVVSALLGVPPAEVTGRGAGLSSDGLHRKIDTIERALRVNRPDPSDVVDVLAKVGGFDLAGLTGVFLGGAAYHVPIIVDGFISAAAALCAVTLCPRAQSYLLASHVSKEPAAQRTLHALALRPLLCADLCLGEGTGAVALLPILDLALAVYDSMSTFSEIQIEEYHPLA